MLAAPHTSGDNALGAADRMWALWTLTKSFAEDVDGGLVESEEADDEFELGDLAELLGAAEGTTESTSREIVDEKNLVGEIIEDVRAGKAHAFPPFSQGFTSVQLSYTLSDSQSLAPSIGSISDISNSESHSL